MTPAMAIEHLLDPLDALVPRLPRSSLMLEQGDELGVQDVLGMTQAPVPCCETRRVHLVLGTLTLAQEPHSVFRATVTGREKLRHV